MPTVSVTQVRLCSLSVSALVFGGFIEGACPRSRSRNCAGGASFPMKSSQDLTSFVRGHKRTESSEFRLHGKSCQHLCGPVLEHVGIKEASAFRLPCPSRKAEEALQAAAAEAKRGRAEGRLQPLGCFDCWIVVDLANPEVVEKSQRLGAPLYVCLQAVFASRCCLESPPCFVYLLRVKESSGLV